MSVQKVRLHSTSRISLNDRFTGLQGADVTDGLQQRRQVVQASRKNQRLALQMEHRPAVIAALNRGGRGRGRGAGGLLRGARGARGMIHVGAAATPQRAVATIPTRPVYRGATRGVTSAIVRGARGRGITTTTRGNRGVGRGSVRGVGRGNVRGVGRVDAQAAVRGNTGNARGGSIRGINFQTGKPLRASAPTTRGRGISNNNNNLGTGGAGGPSVKRRLAVQGRLSQPAAATRGWARGGTLSARLSGVQGRGGVQQRGRGFPTRTFRGRGSRGRGTRGGNRGGYSQQWQNGY